MNHDSDIQSFERETYSQRRSVSFGGTASSDVTDERTTKYEQYIQPNDHDGYICTPLPRTNQQPTAATCWLVILLLPFPSSPRALSPVKTE